jgi:hypothetical protein
MSFSDYPQSATNAAKRALKFKEENGTSCGTPVGWQRANQLASREALSLSTVKRTFSFLSRAEVYDQGRFTDDDGKEICGSIMYAAWGGKAMRGWCNKIIREEEERNELNEQAKTSLKKKVEEHNEEFGDNPKKRATLAMLSAVYKRGIGAYKGNPSSVRPSVKSPEQWAFARVNSFLYALRNERFRGGKHDTDLFPKGHKLSSRSMDENKEIRVTTGLEVRYMNQEDEEKRTLSGYAIKFNDVTTIGDQFREQVTSTALEGVDMSNTFALFNHDWSSPLGRAGRNMNLTVDDTGLRVDIDLPNTSMARDLAELVKNDIVGGMSFGFTIADDSWTRDDEMPLRTINKIDRLYEVTFTPIPAYPTTEVALRNLEQATAEDDTNDILQELHGDHTEAQTSPPSPEQGPGTPEPNMAPQNAPEDKPLAFTKVDALKFLLDNQE